ncbi:MAG: hypothetical protein ACI8TX_000500 [Hyphomicrobiaceae bacterium]|jgi:hypothetical protein
MNQHNFAARMVQALLGSLGCLTARLALVVAVLLGGHLAEAGSTDPVLALGSARIEAHAGSGALLDLTGIWHFDDILQVDFPLTVVAYQGSKFVVVPVLGGATTGTFAGLSDGLAPSEIAALESAGSPTAANLLRIDAGAMAVALPSVFSPGFVEVVVYVELPSEGGFVSNRARAVLTGAGS